jgi:FAD/FMN-containing dehydrogenase
MTFDPCSTGNDGWDAFLEAYNALCTELNGVPLFNQTAHLTRPQVDKAFGDRILKFDRYRKEYDPNDRLLNDYFRNLVAQPSTDQRVTAGVGNVGAR